MGEGTAFLRALQVADGTLPIGRFAHSYGVEAWLEAHPESQPDDLCELVRSTLAASIATLDGAAVALAHAAASRGDMGGLQQIDAALTARKLNESARNASTLCGRQLALLAGQLGIGEVVERLTVEIEEGARPGNLAVVEGAVGAGMGIARDETVLIAVRGHAAAMLSAAVRLGRLGTTRSQALLYELGPDLEDCAATAAGVSLEDMRATLPELEIHAARHAYREVRLFMS
ncbi:MAG: urease accessory protein UreF [Thermoleophilaceae bacterium]|nr:urease accessory protein UreF [Thermoleophilaceae bacterium]